MILVMFVTTAWGQSTNRNPKISYLYPSGGQQGTVFHITAGGQYLRNATEVYISGHGVRASVIRYYKPLRNIQKDQREELKNRFKTLRKLKSMNMNQLVPLVKQRNPKKSGSNKLQLPIQYKQVPTKKKPPKITNPTPKPPVKPVEHPLLYDLENKSLQEINHVQQQLFFPRNKRQLNNQFSEMALIEITIDRDATPGDRELRIKCSAGLTNPLVFQVGQFPEICDLEPNDPKKINNVNNANKQVSQPVKLPVTINGQIMPGDVDRYHFLAQKGEQLVINVKARHLIPYLADTVPGWFQATVALFDGNNKELAFADDYRFDPDPVLFYRIPRNGVYALEIHDSIYRGREDFVYRITVGETPFITRIFPLGGKKDHTTTASINGWNLSKKQLLLDTQTEKNNIQPVVLQTSKYESNPVTYMVSTLPECIEVEHNNTIKEAQHISYPIIINGRIEKSGDVDLYQFQGSAGDQLVAEVHGRRLGSPLDSLLRLTDSTGKILQWNDDYEDKESGLCTHFADSYLMARLQNDGVYIIQLSDTQNHGGNDYAYRLRISSPQPDFALRLTPSSINVRAGQTIPIRVHAIRKDGFEGDINIVMKNAPAGFQLSGNRIPGGCESVRMTLTVPGKPSKRTMVLHLDGHALIGGRTITRPVVPAEDMMQAFLYRHLAPVQELMVSIIGSKRNVSNIELIGSPIIRIPQNGATKLQYKIPQYYKTQELELDLIEPPKGIAIHNVVVHPGKMTFILKTDGNIIKDGYADNLIVEAFMLREEKPKKSKATNNESNDNKPKNKKRVSIGLLPAIPLEIIN
jgi:hypothetical protein